MTAAQTKHHEEEKHTGIRKEKLKKVGRKAKKNENRTEGVHCNKASRLCYKVEPRTLSHYLPSSSCSRRQWYKVLLLLYSPSITIFHQALSTHTRRRAYRSTYSVTWLLRGKPDALQGNQAQNGITSASVQIDLKRKYHHQNKHG